MLAQQLKLQIVVLVLGKYISPAQTDFNHALWYR